MTESVDNRPEVEPATGAAVPSPRPRKAAKRAAKKAAAKAAGKVTVYLVGASHNGKDGDRRVVDAAEAEELVRAGVARYPASSLKSRRPAVWG